LVTDSTVPTFGPWYDFRQRPLGYAGVRLSEPRFVDDGYLLVADRRSRICASSTPRVRDAG
jgi:hypothetical protein